MARRGGAVATVPLTPQDLGIGRLFWAIRDAVAVADADSGRVVLWNPAAERLFGYTAAEALSLRIQALLPDVEAAQRWTGNGPRPDSTSPLQLAARRRDAAELWVEVTVAPLEDARGSFLLAVIRDVGERRRTERALREAEANYRSLVERGVEGIWRTAPDGRMLFANPAMARLLGFETPEQMLAAVNSNGLRLYLDTAQRPKFFQLADAQPTVDGFESEVRRPDGSSGWISENGRAVRDASGAIQYYEGTAIDVTDRKRAQQEREKRLLEQAARGEAEVARRRADLLAGISRSVAEASLDLGAVLERVAQAVAETLGGACSVHLLSADRAWLEPAAVHHA